MFREVNTMPRVTYNWLVAGHRETYTHSLCGCPVHPNLRHTYAGTARDWVLEHAV